MPSPIRYCTAKPKPRSNHLIEQLLRRQYSHGYHELRHSASSLIRHSDFVLRHSRDVSPRKPRAAARAAGQPAHGAGVCAVVRVQRALGPGRDARLAAGGAARSESQPGEGAVSGQPVLSGAIRAGVDDGAELCRRRRSPAKRSARRTSRCWPARCGRRDRAGQAAGVACASGHSDFLLAADRDALHSAGRRVDLRSARAVPGARAQRSACSA